MVKVLYLGIRYKLGRPVVPFYLFFWECSPTKVDYEKKRVPLFQPLYWRT